MEIEGFIKRVVDTIRKMYGEDSRFAQYIKKDPDIEVSYKNGKLIADEISWPCDGGWGRLTVTASRICYEQERSTETLLSYTKWSSFKEKETST